MFMASIYTYGNAQQIDYTVIKDAPQFENIPNLYITPYLLSMDFPLYGPNPDAIMSGYAIGLGLRTHVNIGKKFQADFNFSQGIWPSKTRHLDLGGAIILNTKTKTKKTDIIISTKTVSVNADQIQYITVPYTLMRFSGLRAGLTHYKSIFDFESGPFDKVLNASPAAIGNTNSFGVYGGWTWGKVGNLHIKLKDNRNRSHTEYHQFYFDVLLVGHFHNYTINTANTTVLPVGFRLGADIFKPTVGIMGKGTKFINLEVGYRPGYDGFYAKVGLTFLQIRRNLTNLTTVAQ